MDKTPNGTGMLIQWFEGAGGKVAYLFDRETLVNALGMRAHGSLFGGEGFIKVKATKEFFSVPRRHLKTMKHQVSINTNFYAYWNRMSK